jgi:transcriptional regulator with XRE-family HTH domain
MLLNSTIPACICRLGLGFLSLEIVMEKRLPNPTDEYVGARVRMRRLMLEMSQVKLGHALGLTFQQVQKYEKGTNRIGASRLQNISHILHVPVSFFFEGAPTLPGAPVGNGAAPSPSYVSDFLATSDGLTLSKAFMRIKEPKLQRRIVHLVQEIADNNRIKNGPVLRWVSATSIADLPTRSRPPSCISPGLIFAFSDAMG